MYDPIIGRKFNLIIDFIKSVVMVEAQIKKQK